MSNSDLENICRIDKVISQILSDHPHKSVELLMQEWRFTNQECKDAFVAALIGKLCVMNARAK
jgi:hypothetical protein